MPKEIRAIWDWLRTPEMSAGKITLFTILTGAIVTVMTFGAYFQLGAGWVSASTGTSTVVTSVTVLNVPPVWTVDAHESTESSTSTPTQSGYTLQWLGTGTDSNGDQYYLLICYGTSTTAAPTPHASGAAPTCGSGAVQWAISPYTTSGQPAVAATTTIETFPFNQESNNWYAWICDAAALNPSCNSASEQGYEYGAANGNDFTKISPFVINHPPVFSAVVNSGATLPGGSISWTVTATDTDVIRGGDLVTFWACKSASFATSTCVGGLANTWASSTPVHLNPATSTTIVIPTQDKIYNAYVYIQDSAGHQATSTLEGSNVPFTVLNATPTVSNVTFTSTSSATDIQLFRPHATSGPYYVEFTVTDTNSCQNASAGNEIVSATTSVYRSATAINTCIASSSMNANSCYPSADPQTQIVCTQDTSGAITGNGCSGPTDTTVGWYCTVPIWYNADPTDAGSVFAGQSWFASVAVMDDQFATSTTATSTGTTMDKFLAFAVSTTSIAYGGLQPNNFTPYLVQSNNLLEYGNTGMDEMLYGDRMCTNWSSQDSCDSGHTAADSIPVLNQHYSATSSNPFADPLSFALTSSSSPSILALHVPKTTATSSPNTKNTYWGINVPAAITTSGAYTGQNTIGAVVSISSYW